MTDKVYQRMDEGYLSPKEEENFMQIAANVAEQVNQFEHDVFRVLT